MSLHTSWQRLQQTPSSTTVLWISAVLWSVLIVQIWLVNTPSTWLLMLGAIGILGYHVTVRGVIPEYHKRQIESALDDIVTAYYPDHHTTIEHVTFPERLEYLIIEVHVVSQEPTDTPDEDLRIMSYHPATNTLETLDGERML